jgi:CBS domain-containing protein
MDWIRKHATGLDVLFSNARLVEVGLNLTMFSTGIFDESEWSLYILWQALRRLFRPGAKKNIRMLFPVYELTMEEQLIDLMGLKMRAAQIFYGDEISGALVEENESDILEELVRNAMKGVRSARAEALFGGAVWKQSPAMKQEPVIEIEPDVDIENAGPTWEEMRLSARSSERIRRTKRKEVNQIALF